MTTLTAATSTAADSTRLARAYDACAEITRRRARNFYYGLRLTPEPKRSALYAVYAWMRRADDTVDEPASQARTPEEDRAARRAALDDFRARTERALRAADPEHAAERAGEDDPVWPAIAHAVRTFGINVDLLRAMLDGMAEDLDHDGYADFDELERYCARVASTVGEVCLTIWGLRDDADPRLAFALARRRGLALQLTNILRDFREDFDEGRVYLPRTLFDHQEVSPAELRRWTRHVACERLVRDAVAAARAHFDASAPLERLVSSDCAPAMWAMCEIYRALLEKIDAAPHRIAMGRRVRLSAPRKVVIASGALLAGRLRLRRRAPSS